MDGYQSWEVWLQTRDVLCGKRKRVAEATLFNQSRLKRDGMAAYFLRICWSVRSWAAASARRTAAAL
ncbi:hypothetical protein DYL61_18320 [Pseudomonas nabeulensis]|uniref:Uncharacterized protein n=1 Tax=Pseudomonas nabeulensis TaxID=2293833 RepID=A0A4Z0AXN6_9PSED|nr:hypothetical protein DYL61_18320 [Pseudomonas nabeulensis]